MPSPKTQPAQTRKAYQVLPVTDLTAGLDLRSSPTLLGTDKARSLVNWSLEQPGALMVRPGYLAFSTTSLGAGRIQGGQRVYLNTAIPSANSTAFTLIAWQGGIYHLTDSGGWANSGNPVYSTLSTGTDVFFPHDRDLVGVFDGANLPRKSTNGSSWTRLGIAPGAGNSSVSTNSASSGGFLSGAEYEFSYGYKDRDLAHYSNESSAVSTLTTASTGAVQIQIPNSTDAQVDAVVVYARNKTAGETIRRKISSAAMSSAASSTIVLQSTNWSQNDEAPTDHTVPPVLSFGVVWKNRWWARSATVKNRLHFTQLFQPQSWPALFYLDIPFERGDEIRALDAIGDTLIVHGTTKKFVIVGQTSLDFEVRPTLGSISGTFGPRCTAQVENGIIAADASGVFIFDGASDRYLSQPLEPAWRDLVRNAPEADLQRIAIVYDQQRKEVRITVPRRYPSGTWGEFVLDLNRTQDSQSAWTETNRTIGGYLQWDGPEGEDGNRGRLFSWHSSLARVFEESVGTTANSSNMVADYEGPGLTLGQRLARWVDLRGEYEPHTGTFSVEAVIDGVSQGSRTIQIGAGQAQYGSAVYGTAAYAGSGRKQFYTALPLGAEGRTYVQKAQYSGQQAFKWFGYGPGLVPETKSRDFSE